jgi:hypothetical protein
MNFSCPYCKQKGIESMVTWDGNVDHSLLNVMLTIDTTMY